MKLEGGPLSDERVREEMKGFVCVKIDPRSPGSSRAAFDHKSTRYVPEMVLLMADGEVMERPDRYEPGELAATLKAALLESKKAH